MSLRVAPCPRCRNPIVFGERQCRSCAQPFDYGSPGPPVPNSAQIVDALRAAGIAPPRELAAASGLLDALRDAGPRPVAAPDDDVPLVAVTGSILEEPVPGPAPLPEVDVGRFSDVGDVAPLEVPGLIDSRLFAAFTPRDIPVTPMLELDQGRFDAVGAVDVGEGIAVDRARAEPVQDIPVTRMGDIFGSAVYGQAGEVEAPRIDGLEATSMATTPPVAGNAGRAGRGSGKMRALSADDLSRVVCRCSEIHKLPRCPSCGTAHPDVAGAA